MSKADCLVVDSGGFIRHPALQEVGTRIITLREVVDEIKDKATRERLQVLPYELEYRQPTALALKVVTEFARKTGDYASLSATDIRVLAVTYDLEAELCGTEHLNKAPVTQRTVEFYKPASSSSNRAADRTIAGFFCPGQKAGDEAGDTSAETETVIEHQSDGQNYSSFEYWREPLPTIDLELDLLPVAGEPDQPAQNDRFGAADLPALEAFLQSRSYLTAYQLSAVDLWVAAQLTGETAATANKYCNVSRWLRHVESHQAEKENEDNGVVPNICVAALRERIAAGENFSLAEVVNSERMAAGEQQRGHISSDEGVSLDDSDKENEDDESGEESGEEEEENVEEDDDDDGWITPSNLKDKRAAMAGMVAEDVRVRVACMTTDFAMQNVLKQIGLNIIGTNGMIIRETKTWILRCYACFHTTPLMDKVFCPKCGNKTLKRVSVTLNADGTQQIHISARRPLNRKGKKFSLPAPQGGKHAVNPLLCVDQPAAQQRISKKALARNNPLDPDYISGSSPFVVKDVTSKSAMLGLKAKGKGQAQPSGAYWSTRNPNAAGKNTGNKRK